MKKICKYLLCAAGMFFLAGCSSSIEIKANEDKSCDMNLQLDLGKDIYNTIQDLARGIITISSATEAPVSEVEIFSASEIKKVFEGSDFKNLSVTVPSSKELKISSTIPSPDKQKSVNEGSFVKIANFVTCTNSSLTLILSPENILEFTSTLPAETSSFLDLMMAPVFMDEKMSPAEYKDLISLVYGDELAAVLEKAVIKITLAPPSGKSIKKASLSETELSRTSSGKAVFSIPLIEVLTLENPKTFSITW